MSQKVVAVIGALDTKNAEFQFLKEQIEANGVDVLMIDIGVYGPGGELQPEIDADFVASACGSSQAELARKGDRGFAMDVMGRGAAAVLTDLFREGKINGVISMGGSGGTAVGTTAMRALPLGFPKLMISTVASGDTSRYVGESDILMMPSIVDISGINRFSQMIISNAAAAISGMVKGPGFEPRSEKPLLAATMFGVTTPCVTKAKEIIEKSGYEVLVFHAVGSGGRAMEQMIRDGYIKGVLDITTTEITDELFGGVLSAGPSRLEAAGKTGIPQVVSTGALDMINWGPPDTVPGKYHSRNLVAHNAMNTLMRTTAEELAVIASAIAGKLNRATGKVVFLMPLKGFSMLDMEGQPFFDPEADRAFFKAFQSEINPNVTVMEVDANINDEVFAQTAAQMLIRLIEEDEGR